MKNVVRIYGTAGATLGIVIGLALAFTLGMFLHVGDTLLFCFYHAVLFAVPVTAGGIVVHAIRSAVITIRGRGVDASGLRFHRRFASGFVIGTIACLSLVEWLRPFLLTAGSSLLLLSVFAVFFILGGRAAAAVGAYASRSLPGIERPALRLLVTPVVYGLAVAVVIAVGRAETGAPVAAPQSTVPAANGYRVLLIGLDGATWRVMDRMIADGELPNLAGLVEEGVRADLLSEVSPLNPIANTSSSGMRSASIWTSIATGMPAHLHGVHDFMVSTIAGIPHPVPARVPTWNLFRKPIQSLGLFPVDRKSITPASRHAATIWEIASGCGLTAGVQGWWLTDASLPIHGHKVAPGFSAEESRFFPPSLLENEEIRALIERGDDAPDITPFTSFAFDPDYRDHYRRDDIRYLHNHFVDMFRSDLRRDTFIFDASMILGRISPVDFNAVYFLGPDNVEHLFWKYMEPALFEVTGAEEEAFGDIIESYYRYLDGAVGDLLSFRDERTVVIICSDHGMGPWVGNRSGLYQAVVGRTHMQNSGNHRIEGILIMQGGPCRSGVKITGRRVSVHDIAPTVLHLLGLPVALDMEGGVIGEAFADGFLNANPVRTVPSYGFLRGESREDFFGGEEDEDLYRERLEALGYVSE